MLYLLFDSKTRILSQIVQVDGPVDAEGLIVVELSPEELLSWPCDPSALIGQATYVEPNLIEISSMDELRKASRNSRLQRLREEERFLVQEIQSFRILRRSRRGLRWYRRKWLSKEELSELAARKERLAGLRVEKESESIGDLDLPPELLQAAGKRIVLDG